MDTQKQQPGAQTQLIIVPSPGLGHLIPLTELAKRLVLHRNLFINFVIPSDNKYSPATAQKSLLESLPTNVNCTYLPPVDVDDLPEDTAIEIRISLTVARSLPVLRDELSKSSSSSTRISAVIVDIFSLSAMELCKEIGIPTYIFFSSTAMCLSLVLHMPELDKTYSGEYRDLPEAIQLPGCVALPGKDFMNSVHDRNSEAYKLLIERSQIYNLADGILINSMMELEFEALKALKEEKRLLKPPVYSVGPLVRSISSSSSERQDCLKWLDGQPKGSVLYVSFGSGGALSGGQLNELALGLEMSQQRFLWVVKRPNEKAANAHFFNTNSVENPGDDLPPGFLVRTKGNGLIVPSWAPQVEILSHGSTGGFVTHCGWNSILESIVHGVVMIAWPLYAEQKMNAVLVTEDFGVALRVKADNESGLVGREEIAKLAKGLIEGKERKQLAKKMKELKEAASGAWTQDGSSAMAVCEVAQKLSGFNVK